MDIFRKPLKEVPRAHLAFGAVVPALFVTLMAIGGAAIAQRGPDAPVKAPEPATLQLN